MSNKGTTTKMILLELESGPKKFYHLFESLKVIEYHNLYNRLHRMEKQGYIQRIDGSYRLNRLDTDRTVL